MNMELNLLELNDLYYLASKGVERHRELVENAKNDTPELMGYFDRELDKSIQLLNKISKALTDEVKELEKSREYVESIQRDYSAFKDYADSMNEAQSEDRKLGNI